jgi:hypothetical protein
MGWATSPLQDNPHGLPRLRLSSPLEASPVRHVLTLFLPDGSSEAEHYLVVQTKHAPTEIEGAVHDSPFPLDRLHPRPPPCCRSSPRASFPCLAAASRRPSRSTPSGSSPTSTQVHALPATHSPASAFSTSGGIPRFRAYLCGRCHRCGAAAGAVVDVPGAGCDR